MGSSAWEYRRLYSKDCNDKFPCYKHETRYSIYGEPVCKREYKSVERAFYNIKNLWRYIVKTEVLVLAIKGLKYMLEDLSLYIYRDISFINDFIIYISIRSHIIFLVDYPVIWKLKK